MQTQARRKADVDSAEREIERARVNRTAAQDKALADAALQWYFGALGPEGLGQVCFTFLQATGQGE